MGLMGGLMGLMGLMGGLIGGFNKETSLLGRFVWFY